MTFVRDFRSKKAVEADQLQEQLLQQRRWVFQVTATVTVLIEIAFGIGALTPGCKSLSRYSGSACFCTMLRFVSCKSCGS